MSASFASAGYWEARYRSGGTSGAGSRGRLLAYKTALVNALIEDNRIGSVIDLGVATYTGLDVAPTTLARCAARFADRPGWRFLPLAAAAAAPMAELGLSLDVIFHLTEDDAYAAHLALLFARASRLVAIYASNAEQSWPARHVRHRRFTADVAATQPGWRLLAHLPNPCPYDPAREQDTSFADFFVYGRAGDGIDDAGCVIRLPRLP
jgi:hypothetical protein